MCMLIIFLEKRLKVDLPSDNVYFTSDEIQSLFEADMVRNILGYSDEKFRSVVEQIF